MIQEILHNNLASWIAQVFVVASVGAFLPLVFRIRHPRTHLAYCHAVLAACAILPLIQPWHHAMVSFEVSSSVVTTSIQIANRSFSSSLALNWERYLFLILVAGFVLRLGWLGIGMWQIRRYRIASVPLYPVPHSVGLASERTHATAIFCLSQALTSPATAGVLRPVVLLPESFLQMSEESQHGIACHELIHVQRKDWLVTVFEEVLAAVFWFHPGVWWLLAQTRLSREQLVDEEVVRLTSARESYIAALLAIAGTRLELDLAPAPFFLRRRHLTQRMHSLLTEVSMSRLRLVSSYVAMAAILAATAWVLFLSFPMEGQAQVVVPTAPIVQQLVQQSAAPAPATAVLPKLVAAAAQDAPPPPPPPPPGVVGGPRGGAQGGTGAPAPPPPPPPPPPSQDGERAPIRVGGDVQAGNIVYKVNPPYPPLARDAHVEGSVVMSVTISKEGHVADAKIISASSPLLLPGAIEAVAQWVYKPTLLNGEPVAVITTVTINYSLGQ